MVAGGDMVAEGGGSKLMCGNLYVVYKSLSATVVANPIRFESDSTKNLKPLMQKCANGQTGLKH